MRLCFLFRAALHRNAPMRQRLLIPQIPTRIRLAIAAVQAAVVIQPRIMLSHSVSMPVTLNAACDSNRIGRNAGLPHEPKDLLLRFGTPVFYRQRVCCYADAFSCRLGRPCEAAGGEPGFRGTRLIQ